MTAEIIAIALGLAVGLSLGALGGGGSTLAVPILVFVAGLDAKAATGASLLVVGIAAGVGAVGHYRHGNVRLGAGVAFGLAGLAGSRLGTTINRSLNEDVLLAAFAGLILFVAIRMYRSVAPQGPAESISIEPTGDPGGTGAGVVGGSDGSGDSGGSGDGLATMVATRRDVSDVSDVSGVGRFDMSAASLGRLAAAATAVGMLTGLFGVGGGFAVVPALTLLLKFPPKVAIGTSLVVIMINAAMSLAMRGGDLGFDWGLVGPFLATVTAGVLVGSRVARNIDADRLVRGFAVMLGMIAIYTAASTALGA